MVVWPFLVVQCTLLLVLVTVKNFWVLLWWWWTHSLAMLSRCVSPAGQGVRWSFWQTWASFGQPGKVHVTSRALTNRAIWVGSA